MGAGIARRACPAAVGGWPTILREGEVEGEGGKGEGPSNWGRPQEKPKHWHPGLGLIFIRLFRLQTGNTPVCVCVCVCVCV